VSKSETKSKKTVTVDTGIGSWEIVSNSSAIARRISEWYGPWAVSGHPTRKRKLSAKVIVEQAAAKVAGSRGIQSGKEGVAIKLSGVSVNADWHRIPWKVTIQSDGRRIENALRVVTRLLAMRCALASGGVVLHASSASLNGMAVVFAGKSGVGKSTAVNKFPAASRLDDDTVILMEREGVWVRPDMPNLEAPSAFAPKQGGELPVGALILPEAAPVFHTRIVSETEAFRACLHLPPAWMLPDGSVPEGALQKVLSGIGRLVKNVKVVRMGWRLSDDLPTLLADFLKSI
jgi:hypothetical protein